MKPKRPAKAAAKPPIDSIDSELVDESDADDGAERVISRPDGFHWLSADGRREFGPFEAYNEALADMQSADGDGGGGAAPGSLLQAAEDEIGIADWIDPDTGEPAEGHSPPHLQDE